MIATCSRVPLMISVAPSDHIVNSISDGLFTPVVPEGTYMIRFFEGTSPTATFLITRLQTFLPVYVRATLPFRYYYRMQDHHTL